MIIYLISIFLLLNDEIRLCATWTYPDISPKTCIKYDQTNSHIFFGNMTDHFKILDQDEKTLLIGARNAVYNVTISLNGLKENTNQRIEWKSTEAHQQLCSLKGKQEFDCQNYIRVFARLSPNQIMICGTNSYKPLCRYYNMNGGGEKSTTGAIEHSNEIEAPGKCPYSPTHNSTYIFIDGQLYSATVADFSGADPIILRDTQRTEQYDLKQLNQPAFVNALEFNGYVFFFFREISGESANCGKAVYSRVGRVCKNDKGGPYPFGNRWTSFLKSRLNCSVPGDYPFYFDEVQATTKIIEGLYNNQNDSIVYAIMNTPPNSIGGSAICAFSMYDIVEAFEGQFKEQRDLNSNWMPLMQEMVPEPRPGKCVDDSRTLPSVTVKFAKTHTLMETNVDAKYGRPVLSRVTLNYRFSAIVVDPQVHVLNGQLHDVLFVGTDNGRVIKFVNIVSANASEVAQTIVIAEHQVLVQSAKVTELTINHRTQKLIVVGQGQIVAIPLYSCDTVSRCCDCISHQDPYCAWDSVDHECIPITHPRIKQQAEASKNRFLQDVQGEQSSSLLCKKYSSCLANSMIHRSGCVPNNNFNTNVPMAAAPKIVKANTHHGTVGATGPGSRSSAGKSISNTYENEITVTSIEGVELPNELHPHYSFDAEAVRNELDHDKQIYMGGSTIIGVAIIASLMFLIVGILIGFWLNRKYNKHPQFSDSETRNKLMWKENVMPRKDTNHLMNGNPYVSSNAAVLAANNSSVNNKKDNLEILDFSCGKDRSRELKNSTESLEKDCKLSTETLPKVKLTYI